VRWWDIILNGERAGRVELCLCDNPNGQLAYTVFPRFRGQGIATAACRLALEEARAMGLASITVAMEPGNRASVRVAEKLGGRLTEDKPMRRYVVCI